jgi:flagellar hook protein FlgE
MIRSLYSAVSGLRGHQTMLDVIGNNIANVNTASFKSSRVIFSDLYYQTLSGASAPTATTGGSNPTQIGYGSLVSSIDVVNSRSSFQQTSRALDMYIAGEGYFVVQNSTNTKSYTRLGAFSFDPTGNLLDSDGNKLMGQMPPLNGTMTTTPVPITVANFNNYASINIQMDGTITGTNNTTGTIDQLGQLAIAVFQNPNGLQQQGTSYYQETVNSGAPTYAAPGSPAAGSLVSGGLEMSNVDLSKEFTDMIIAQRGFQANARVITTSDQVLEELVNLKR